MFKVRIAHAKERAHECLIGFLVAGVLLATASLPAGATALEHEVRSGENLTFIARQYGTTVDRLIALNALKNPNQLRRGQRLVVGESRATEEIQVHVVKRGESLSVIAARYGVSPEQLAVLNSVSDPDKILPGQELVVAASAATHRVKPGESVSVIAKSYGVTVASIALVNRLKDPDRVRVGQVLTIPPMGGGVAQALAGTRSRTYRRTLDRWPVRGTVTSEYGPRGGRMHEGIDIAVPRGTPIRAVAAGRVSYADWAGSYGILVKIDHGGGLETRYAHNSRLVAKPGDYVAAGEIVARSGSTGQSTGPHLHFELRVQGEAVDPRIWLP